MTFDVLACGIKYLSSWSMLFADEIVLRSTRREEVETKLDEWRMAVQDKGLNINIKKMYMPNVQWRWELG